MRLRNDSVYHSDLVKESAEMIGPPTVTTNDLGEALVPSLTVKVIRVAPFFTRSRGGHGDGAVVPIHR